MRRVRIAFDLGGVLTRYPEIYRAILEALVASEHTEAFVLTDMTRADARAQLDANGMANLIDDQHLICASWGDHGERCKEVARLAYDLDVHIDDNAGYLGGEPAVRLLQMPSTAPYTASEWKTP